MLRIGCASPCLLVVYNTPCCSGLRNNYYCTWHVVVSYIQYVIIKNIETFYHIPIEKTTAYSLHHNKQEVRPVDRKIDQKLEIQNEKSKILFLKGLISISLFHFILFEV